MIVSRFRARLRAEAPTHAGSGDDQDRHLTMSPLPIAGRYDTRNSRWLAADRAQARIRPLNSRPIAPTSLCRNVTADRSSFQPRQFLQTKQSQPLPRLHILLPDPAANSP
jgi:hypothetical protein